jgi:bilirubin oxidase
LPIDSTVHWHGLAVPADQDGSPMDPVAPGTRRLYEYDVPMGSAGTYWHHPHAHGTTTLQVGMGLAAPLIVRAAADPLGAMPEQVLMVTSIQLDSSARVQRPAMTMGGMGMMSGGGELLVNGQKLPVLSMAPGATQRWRILNATADRYLRIALDGHRFAVVGTDGGLLAQPIAGLAEWLLAPAQRVEIVVTISTRQGTAFVLRDLGSGSMMATGGSSLMTVTTSRATAKAPVALPAALRPATILGPSTFRQQVVLSSAGMMGMSGSFLINGRTFDMNRVDLRTVVGRVETWDFVNTTAMDHPMHIHGTQFQVVGGTLGGLAGPVADSAWFDTVNVPAGRTVSIRTRQGSPGKRMFHCHILPHEDAGMMAVLEVLPG